MSGVVLAFSASTPTTRRSIGPSGRQGGTRLCRRLLRRLSSLIKSVSPGPVIAKSVGDCNISPAAGVPLTTICGARSRLLFLQGSVTKA